MWLLKLVFKTLVLLALVAGAAYGALELYYFFYPPPFWPCYVFQGYDLAVYVNEKESYVSTLELTQPYSPFSGSISVRRPSGQQTVIGYRNAYLNGNKIDAVTLDGVELKPCRRSRR